MSKQELHAINVEVSETARHSNPFLKFDKDGKKNFIVYLKNRLMGIAPLSAHMETARFVFSVTRGAPA